MTLCSIPVQVPTKHDAAAGVSAANKPTFGLGIKPENKRCGNSGFLFWDYYRMQLSLWIRHSEIALYRPDYNAYTHFMQHILRHPAGKTDGVKN